jgi:hypothetical protein
MDIVVAVVANPVPVDRFHRVVPDGLVINRCRAVINGAIRVIRDMAIPVMAVPVMAIAFIVTIMTTVVVVVVTAMAVTGLRTERRNADDQAGSEGTELFHVLSPCDGLRGRPIGIRTVASRGELFIALRVRLGQPS